MGNQVFILPNGKTTDDYDAKGLPLPKFVPPDVDSRPTVADVPGLPGDDDDGRVD